MVAIDFRLAIILLFYIPASCLSAAPGTLKSFLEPFCIGKSVINSTFDIPVGTCLVTDTQRMFSLAVQILPPCSTGVATLAIYHDKSCANAVDVADYKIQTNCYYDDNENDRIIAVQFVCQEVEGGTVAATITTATFGSSLIPIASGAPLSGTGSRPTTPSSNDAAPTKNPTSSSPPTSSSLDGNGSGQPASAISQKSTIALSVAIPAAAVLVALLAWWFPCRKGQGLGGNHHPQTHHMPTPIPPHYPNWKPTASPIDEVPATGVYKYQ